VPVLALGLGEQSGESAGKDVDLVGRELGAVGELRLLLGKQPLQPEHQGVLLPPLDGRHRMAGLDLGQGSIERPPGSCARLQYFFWRRKRLACPFLDAGDVLAGRNGRGRRGHSGRVRHFEASLNQTDARRTPCTVATLIPAAPSSRVSRFERRLRGPRAGARGRGTHRIKAVPAARR
jgi:hypothetical protein